MGCLLANLIGSATVWDVAFGSLATLIAAVGTYALRENRPLAALCPVAVSYTHLLDEEGQALMIYRLKQELVIDGVSYGSYCLYSNPFTVTVTAP